MDSGAKPYLQSKFLCLLRRMLKIYTKVVIGPCIIVLTQPRDPLHQFHIGVRSLHMGLCGVTQEPET